MDSRQFISGSVAGCVGQCVGHPLDSIKVVMQTATTGVIRTNTKTTTTTASSQKALTAYQSAVEMYRSPYGFRSFFRGLSLPLMTKSVEQCVAFGIKGAVVNFLSPQASNSGVPDNFCIVDDSLRAGISGSVAGACTALLLTPVYLVKVQLQATTTITNIAMVSATTKTPRAALEGPIEAIKATVARLGWRGLYTGALPTFLGSSIGYGFRFATYDKTVNWVNSEYFVGGGEDSSSSRRTSKILSIVLGGGLAGMATWLSHFPLDLVANKMMAEVILSHPSEAITTASSPSPSPSAATSTTTHYQKKGMIAQFRSIYQQQGWKGYFRGIGPCLLRAFPVNAVIFLSYEACMGGL
jgi:hypothetical protein